MPLLPRMCGIIILLTGILCVVPSVIAVSPTIFPVSVDSTTPVLGDTFSVTASMSGALPVSVYFFKCRVGSNSSSLSDGQTYNVQTGQWLDDTGSNGAWIDMPQITTDSVGAWQGAVHCRIKNSASDEAKVLFARACLNSNNSCGTSFQSSNSLTLNPVVPTATPTLTPTPAPTATPTPTPDNTPTPTPTRTPTPTKTPTPTPTKTPTPTPKHIPTTLATQSALFMDSSESANILGETDVAATESAAVKSRPLTPIIISLALVGLGLGILSLALVWQKRNALNSPETS